MYNQSFFMEIFASFVLVLLHLLCTHRVTALSRNWGLNAIVFGSFYGSLIMWQQSQHMGTANSAYGLTQQINSCWADCKYYKIKYVWIYIVCPLFGALIAWPVYELIYRPIYNQIIHEGSTQTDVKIDIHEEYKE